VAQKRTVAEVRAAVVTAGYEGEPTPEILRQFGWEPADPLEHVEIVAPVRTVDQMRDDAALLVQEAKENNVATNVINGIMKFAGIAIKAAGL
jgi:hypothetical protein